MATKSTRKKQSSFRPWPLSLLPQPLIPEAMAMFIARRVVDSLAVLLMLAGICGAIALFTYHPGDPAWNVTGGSGDIQNMMGATGAAFADLAVQTVGYGILTGLLILTITGYRLWRRRATALPLSVRIMAFILSVFTCAAVFAPFPAPDEWGNNLYLGGVIGAKIMNMTTAFLPVSFMFVSWVYGVTGVILAAFAIGYPNDSWARGWDRLVGLTAFTIHKIKAACGWVSHYDALAHATRSRVTAESRPKALEKLTDAIDLVTEKVTGGADTEDRDHPVAPAPQEPVVVKPSLQDTPSSTQGQKSLAFTSRYDEEWVYPPLDLLQNAPPQPQAYQDDAALQRNAQMLQQVLEDFSVQGDIVKIHPGPVVTLYELEPAPGTKSSRVIGLADDIARSMSAVSVRAAVIPGRNVIGIEIPNKSRAIVYMRDILAGRDYQDTKCKLPLVLGKDIGGAPIIADLARMPHLLVAGTTGSGKSVAVNTMLLSLLFKLPPEKCRFIMIDPKMLELSVYNDIPHLLSPVVTEPGKAVVALKWAVHEMEERYRAMSKLGVRNIDGYNARVQEAQKKGETLSRRVQTGFDPDTGKPTYEEQPIALEELPYIVIIVDEFADLMLVAGKEVENAIQRLAQMARAAGLHIIMATQRPSVDVITGVIKANFPTRISFQVTSKIDSRTILGEGGAEQLLGMGDMLFMAGGGQIKRVHGPFVADKEVEDVVNHLKAQGEPEYLDSIDDDAMSEGGNGLFDMFGEGSGEGDGVDELYDQAVAIVAREGKASTSFIQRHLQIGYNRAARIIEEMERQGVVSPATATGKREVLVGER